MLQFHSDYGQVFILLHLVGLIVCRSNREISTDVYQNQCNEQENLLIFLLRKIGPPLATPSRHGYCAAENL